MHSKIISSHNFKQKSGYWLTCFNFWGLKVQRNSWIWKTVTINIKLIVWKLKYIHYNHQTLSILAEKGSITTITSPNVHPYLIAYDCTGCVEDSCMETAFQLSQQTVIIRIASQGLGFQISHVIITVEFTPFWGYLQLGHPVTCENIKF